MPLALTVFGAVLDASGNPAGPGSYGVVAAVGPLAVPEPPTAGLSLAALAGMAWVMRRRKPGLAGERTPA